MIISLVYKDNMMRHSVTDHKLKCTTQRYSATITEDQFTLMNEKIAVFLGLRAGDSGGWRHHVFRLSVCMRPSILVNMISQKRLEGISSILAQLSTWTQRWTEWILVVKRRGQFRSMWPLTKHIFIKKSIIHSLITVWQSFTQMSNSIKQWSDDILNSKGLGSTNYTNFQKNTFVAFTQDRLSPQFGFGWWH